MKTNNNYSSCSIVNRELQSILESRNEVKTNKLTVKAVQTKEGRKGWELAAALLIPIVVFTVVFILSQHGLIREF